MDFIAEILGIFTRDIGQKTEALGKAIEASDDITIMKLAHGIKGMAANISALSVSALASELEKAGKAAEKQKYSALFRQLADAAGKTVAEIGRILAQGNRLP